MAARQPIVTATTRPVSSYVPAPAYTSAYSTAAYTPTTSYAYQHTTMPTTSYPPPILNYPQVGHANNLRDTKLKCCLESLFSMTSSAVL